MKTSLLIAVWMFATVSGHTAERPTLQSLVGREFLINDDLAGQSLSFKSKGDSICAVWRVLGSGRPVISEVEYSVEVKSPWQCVFEVQLRDKSRNSVKVGLGNDRAEVFVYLNGVRIVVQEIRPNKAPEPTPGSVTPRAMERASK